MRILLVTHAFPPEGVGGTERYAEAIARGLLQRGHEVRLFSGSLEWREAFAIERHDHAGLPVTRVHRHDLYFDHWDKLANPHVARAFEAELDAFRPELIHLHHWIRLTDDLVRRAAARAIPVVVHLHDHFTNCPRVFRLKPGGDATRPDELDFCELDFTADSCRSCVPRWQFQGDREIDLSLARYGTAIGAELAAAQVRIALSASQKGELARFLRRANGAGGPASEPAIDILGHPWIGGAVDAAGTVAASPRGQLRLLYFSHLNPIKGPHVLLEALRGLDGVSLDLHGLCATKGYDERLRELARGLEVRFHGPYQRNEPCRTPADVVVIPSLAHETWSFWLDEAARTGLPIVAADSGALAERATGRVRLVPARDVAAWRAAIVALRDDPAQRAALAAAPAPDVMTLDRHLELLLGHYARAAAAITPAAKAAARPFGLPSAEFTHEWERRELAFRELLRSEGWEAVLGRQTAEIERLRRELSDRAAEKGSSDRR